MSKKKARPTQNGRRAYSVYVIELKEEIWEDKRRMRIRNPNRDHTLPCVYVGQTSKTPEERLQQHKDGPKGSRFIRGYVHELIPDLYERHNPIDSQDKAKDKEEELAIDLHARGYAVWWN